MVDKRCAMAIVVLPFAAWSSAAWTTFSEFESRADVASSNNSTFGLRKRARAIAIRSVNICQCCGPQTFERRTFLTARELGSLSTDLGIKTTIKDMKSRLVNGKQVSNILGK